MTTDPDLDELRNRFTYHPPVGQQPQTYEQIRTQAREIAFNLVRVCPPSRELSLALTYLEQVAMWANAAVARHGLRESSG